MHQQVQEFIKSNRLVNLFEGQNRGFLESRSPDKEKKESSGILKMVNKIKDIEKSKV